MTYIKIIFKSLLKRKLSSLFIIIQLTITIVMLLSSFMMLSSTNYLQNQVKEKGLDLKKTLHLKIYNKNLSNTYKENYNQLESYIDTIPEVSNSGSFDFSNIQFKELETNVEYMNIRKAEIKGTFKEEYPTSSEILILDKGIYNLLNLKIINGNGLEPDDFYKDDKSIIPILAGGNYKDALKVGQTLTRADNNCTYQIVGFIDKNSSWFSEHDYIQDMLQSLDNKFILPYTDSERTSNVNVLAKSKSFFYVVNDDDMINYVKNIIETKADTLNLRVQSDSISEDLITFRESTNDIIYSNLFLSIFLIIFSCLGISTIMISSISNRKREFGIRISTGASTSYIRKLIIGEVSVLSLIASTISIIFVLIDNIKNHQLAKYDADVINPMDTISFIHVVFVFVVMVLIVIFTTYLPLKNFRKISVKELIGGID